MQVVHERVNEEAVFLRLVPSKTVRCHLTSGVNLGYFVRSRLEPISGKSAGNWIQRTRKVLSTQASQRQLLQLVETFATAGSLEPWPDLHFLERCKRRRQASRRAALDNKFGFGMFNSLE